jgi:2-polyprenyl-3-methyl-5-hydroxy-6-metoxy-1,4-benzoquinol methylase
LGVGASAEASDWEETSCLLCGGDRRSIVLEAAERAEATTGTRPAVVRCDACGLCYTSPRPTPAAMHRFYPEDYSPHRLQPHAKSRKRRKGWTGWLGWNSGVRSALLRLQKGRLLDFGCGGGKFLAEMHADGWQVLGVDLSEAVVERVQQELGLPALAGDLSAPQIEASSFEVITMRQSLEHVHDPLEVLRQARRLLVPGGTLIVWVPNIDSLPFRWFGPAWYGLDLPRHLTHFTPATLRRMVVEAGFQAGKLWMVRHSSWLQRSAERARELGRRGPKSRWLAWRAVCRWVTRYAFVIRQSDCIALTAARPDD